ncbi:MAG: SpoIIE family protein phosphatase [Leptospira sp.]|nr:SpoIIE family protein phosphatase [Leptospira sp.]
MLPAGIMLFNYSIFRIPVRTKETILLFLLCLIAIIQVTNSEMENRITLLRIWKFLLLFVLFLVSKTVIQKVKEIQVEAYLVCVGFLVLCAGAFIDIGIDLTTGKNIYLSQYGFLSLMILSAVSISHRNSKNEKELSLLTKNLEDRVKEGTTELEQKNLDLKTDLIFASQLQGHLLPKFSPKISGFQIQAIYLPMKQVGGDMDDWVELDSSKILLILADVAGHGVPAAFVSSMVKFQFRESAKIHSSPD